MANDILSYPPSSPATDCRILPAPLPAAAPTARRHGPRCPLNARHALSPRRPVQSGMADLDSVQRALKRLARLGR